MMLQWLLSVQFRLVRGGHVPAAGRVPAQDGGQGGLLRRQAGHISSQN